MNSATQTPARSFFAHLLTVSHFMTFRSLPVMAGCLSIVAVAVGIGAVPDGRAVTQVRQKPGDHLPVETVALAAVDSFDVRRTYTGVVKAERTSELSFERNGKLITVEVEEGDRVELGQVLARLDVRNLQAKQRELDAQRAAAAALLAELRSGPRVETIEAARALVRQLEAELALQTANLARNRQLIRERAVAQADFDATQYGTKVAEARLVGAKAQLAELETGTRQEKFDAQEAVVAQLDAALADVMIDIEDGTLNAPFRGVVSKRYADEGAIVSPSESLLRLVEQDQLEVWIGLPASTATRFELGGQHVVTIDAAAFGATVKAVLPELDPATRTRHVVLKLDPKAIGRVVPSQVARMDVTEPTPSHGYWVPTTALARGDRGLWSLYVAELDDKQENAIVARRDVEVLHAESDRVFVRGTVQSGDRVIAYGIHRVVPGQLVQTQQPQVSAVVRK